MPEETCARDRTCTGFLVCERDATRLLRLRGLEKLADAAGAAPARSCSTGRQTCCCYSRPKLADHRRMGMRGGDCRRQPVRALLAGARASTRRARLMAHSRHPAGCAAHSLSRFARLSGSSSKAGCRMDRTNGRKSVPGRNCTCGLKVRNLAFCLLNYGDEKVGPPPGLAPGSRPYQGRASLSMLRRQTAACR